MLFRSGGNLRVTGASVFGGSTIVGTEALATTATDGFLYIPSCAGVPTGVPTSKTGTVALVYNSADNALYVYNGAWKNVSFASNFIIQEG